jgi:hypothetical protein
MKKKSGPYRSIAITGVLLGLIIGSATVVYAQVGGGFDLSWNTIDGGGGTFSTGGAYSLGGTLGQPDAGSLSSGQFTLNGGFWGGVLSVPTSTATPALTSTPGTTSTPTNTATRTPSNTNTSTNTPTGTPTGTALNTATPTSISTATPGRTATATAGPSSTSIRTPTGTPTYTPTLIPSATNTPTMTQSAIVTRTATGTITLSPTWTASPTPIATGTSSVTPTGTATGAATYTMTPPTRTTTMTPTYRATAGATTTPTYTATSRATTTAGATSTSISIATATATECSLVFEDVHSSDWFYEYVQYMYCHAIVSGYNTSPPCSQPGVTCFRPGNNTTRGQLTKIVVRAFNILINTQGGPHFSDVLQGSTFYDYIETGYNLGLWGGYADGTFKPNNNVTRGQITKMVVNAAIQVDPTHWTLEDPPINTFEDVEVDSTFFRYIETAVSHRVVNGYPCGAPPAGPCIPPLNKPYFVPNANATRAQISKISYLAVTYASKR